MKKELENLAIQGKNVVCTDPKGELFGITSEIFEKEGRKQFNPMFLVPILNNLTNTYLQHYVELSNGMKGKIVLINKNELSRPMIATDDNQFVDLLKQRDIKITQVR